MKENQAEIDLTTIEKEKINSEPEAEIEKSLWLMPLLIGIMTSVVSENETVNFMATTAEYLILSSIILNSDDESWKKISALLEAIPIFYWLFQFKYIAKDALTPFIMAGVNLTLEFADAINWIFDHKTLDALVIIALLSGKYTLKYTFEKIDEKIDNLSPHQRQKIIQGLFFLVYASAGSLTNSMKNGFRGMKKGTKRFIFGNPQKTAK